MIFSGIKYNCRLHLPTSIIFILMTIFSILIVNSGALPKGREKTEETLRDMETINYPYTGNETEHFEHSVHVELSK